jgi:adenylate kinase
MTTYPKIFILGPQGAGKGTQAERIARYFGIPHVIMSDLLLHEVAKKSVLGKQINAIITKGHLVPDELSAAMMVKRIRRADCRHGWLIDGFPRAIKQAKIFNQSFQPNIILLLQLSDNLAVKRLAGRRICPNGHVYHIKHKQPGKRQGFCDIDGLPLKIRYDDTPAAIRTRLKIFHHRTEPAIELYKKQALFIRIDARPGIDQVYRQAIGKLKRIPWLSSPLKKK